MLSRRPTLESSLPTAASSAKTALTKLLHRYVYWLMGALTNSSSRLAYFAAMNKGLQSAGAAVMYRLDNLEKPYMTLLISNWIILPVSLVIAFPVAFWTVHEHSDIESDREGDAGTDVEKPVADIKA